MNNQLKNIIDQYKNGQLKVRNKSFSTETILDEFIGLSSFTNVNFLDLNLTNVDFGLSFFDDCSFENCNFDTTLFREASFLNCNFKNCSLKNCNFIKAEFEEIKFDNCSFEKAERGSLSKAWFESCHFIETNFNGFNFGSLIATAVEDSKFSKFNKTIEFQGKFFLIDILESKTGLEGMLFKY